MDIISNTINEYVGQGIIKNPYIIEYVNQDIALGTGDAIKCCLPQINLYWNERALILSGDVPLISFNTLKNLIKKNINRLLITELENPFGCGRIILNESGNIMGIKEEKDCGEEEKLILLVNCGIYQIAVSDLIRLIPKISNNNKSQEYYLTDIIDLMISYNIPIETFILEKNSQWEIKNVNTKKDLEELNDFIVKKCN